jgi:hypothetical protein
VRAVALLLACAAPVLAGGDRPMNPTVSSQRPFAAPTFYLQYLQVGRKYVFETRNLTKHADSALVMLEDERPVAYNEDRPPVPEETTKTRESRLEFVPKRYASYAVQLRAEEGKFGGTCDLYMDGKLLGKDLVFGELLKRPKKVPMPMPGKIVKPGVEPEVDQYEIPPRTRPDLYSR